MTAPESSALGIVSPTEYLTAAQWSLIEPRLPTLIANGDNDRMVPTSLSDELHRCINGKRMCWAPIQSALCTPCRRSTRSVWFVLPNAYQGAADVGILDRRRPPRSTPAPPRPHPRSTHPHYP